MLNNLAKYDICLSSNSPRRTELLVGLDIKFRIITLSDVYESYSENHIVDEVPLFLSQKKAQAYSEFIKDDTLLITADTVVISQGKIMGKPKCAEHAKEMLCELSGKTHKVITGVTIKTSKESISFDTTSYVTFSELSESEIDYYINKYSPYDKAGSYGIQEWIGYIGVEKIEGSYFNVMGLPVQKLYTVLKNLK